MNIMMYHMIKEHPEILKTTQNKSDTQKDNHLNLRIYL